ncbi:MAG: metallophosphoesterase [Oscillospiraceae bacterium]|nr:metallophosphoesterase [Oscillospiraceae bacterium]
MDELVNDLSKLIEPVQALVNQATSYIEPEVNIMISERIVDKKRIEKAFDELLNYAGMSKSIGKLFKRLCNHYFFIFPDLVSDYISFYLDMYGSDDECYTDKYDDEGFYINSIDTIREAKQIMINKAVTIITGDTHGDFRRIESMCVLAGTTKEDLLIILGDAGINYYGGKKEMNFKSLLSKLPITMLCVHGNHERRPETLGTYKEIPWNGGIVYTEENFSNLLFAKDGEIYNINGKKCIVIGGAYSVDKEYRLERNWGWWADEQPSEEVKRIVESRLDKSNWHVDVVLTHTAPLKYEPREMFLDFIDDSKVDKSTETWLGTIEDRLDYKEWYCGHYHTNKSIDKIRFLYNDFYELK